MSTRGVRAAPVRGYRRRKTNLGVDLNEEPPGDNQDQEGTSIQVETQNVQGSQQGHSVAPAMIDIEPDDDVIESSPRAFDEAKKNSRRNRGRNIIYENLEEQTRPTRKRRRNNTIFINLESNSTRESTTSSPEPTFSCPICLRPLQEEMSTKCGHIFCKKCITVAITAQGKCPSCRNKAHLKELIRVYLPSTC